MKDLIVESKINKNVTLKEDHQRNRLNKKTFLIAPIKDTSPSVLVCLLTTLSNVHFRNCTNLKIAYVCHLIKV